MTGNDDITKAVEVVQSDEVAKGLEIAQSDDFANAVEAVKNDDMGALLDIVGENEEFKNGIDALKQEGLDQGVEAITGSDAFGELPDGAQDLISGELDKLAGDDEEGEADGEAPEEPEEPQSDAATNDTNKSPQAPVPMFTASDSGSGEANAQIQQL